MIDSVRRWWYGPIPGILLMVWILIIIGWMFVFAVEQIGRNGF